MCIFLEKILGNRKGLRGSVLLYVMVFGALAFSIIVLGTASYSLGEYKASVYRSNQESALAIAEAGINYYRWHLAHNPTDYKDGTTNPPPYVHVYKDKDGSPVGRYSLNIIPPGTASSTVTVESTGWLDSQPSSHRTIRAKFGFNALTNYAFIGNTDIWIGNETEISGQVHSNGGIRFDGEAEAPVTSAVATYVCKPVHGNGCQNQTKPGVWGQGGPTSYWQFPVVSQDFTGVSVSLAQIKLDAGLSLSSSGKQGWHLLFNNNGTVTASKVSATKCYKGDDLNGAQDSWFCVDIKTEDSGTTYPIPANGLIYVDDTTWVDGMVKGIATVAAGTGRSIIINGNILYVALDGKSKLGLIADQDIIIPHDSLDTFTIDAAVFALNGSAKRYYYSGDMKDKLKVYGSIVSAGTWTWSWISNGGSVVSGYREIKITYDQNLNNSPPAGFPKGSSLFLISWEEIK